jgi:hypothetical protein
VVLANREAFAELPLLSAKGWDVSIDGRLNTFISFSQGDAQPSGAATWTGIEDRAAGTDHIAMTRVRSGFITNVFGFRLVKQLTPDLKVTGRFATWVGVSQARDKSDNPAVDVREVYVKMEGDWGGILAGRDLSLFARGAILLDYEIHHAYGLGHPCAIRTVRGGACGFAGHGILFPSFNAGIVYSTPELSGLQLSVGAYDPATVGERQYERTPFPRVEAELTYKWPGYFHLFADALWQRIGSNTNPEQNPDATGIAAGAGVTLGPFAAGFAYHTGKGLGLYVPLENSPLFSDDNGVLRRSHGLAGMASLSFGETKIAGGAGMTELLRSEFEPTGPLMVTFPKRQLGISAGVYQGIDETLFFALEYFRGYYDWHQSTVGGNPKQRVNFVNAGVTLVW